MVHNTPASCNYNQTIPIPRGMDFSGFSELEADLLALFASKLLRRTASRKEYQSGEQWVGWHRTNWNRSYTGDHRGQALYLATHNPQWFEWNHAYSTGFLTEKGEWYEAHSKTVRLHRSIRTGEFDLYSPRTMRANRKYVINKNLDNIGRGLLHNINNVWLPDNITNDNLWQHLVIQAVKNQQFYGIRCKFANRFHSNFTSMASNIREQLVSYIPLCSVDIKSCQPLMLGALAAKNLGQMPEVKHWLSLCQEGDVYTSFAGYAGMQRPEAKETYIKMLFQRVEPMKENPAFYWMQKHFPKMASMLCSMKSRNYTKVAQALQRMESHLVIDLVARDFMREFPGKPLVTIHDECILGVDQAERLLTLIRRHSKKLGINPKVVVSETNKEKAGEETRQEKGC